VPQKARKAKAKLTARIKKSEGYRINKRAEYKYCILKKCSAKDANRTDDLPFDHKLGTIN